MLLYIIVQLRHFLGGTVAQFDCEIWFYCDQLGMDGRTIATWVLTDLIKKLLKRKVFQCSLPNITVLQILADKLIYCKTHKDNYPSNTTGPHKTSPSSNSFYQGLNFLVDVFISLMVRGRSCFRFLEFFEYSWGVAGGFLFCYVKGGAWRGGRLFNKRLF